MAKTLDQDETDGLACESWHGETHKGFEDYDHVKITLDRPVRLKFKKGDEIREELIEVLIMREADASDIENISIPSLKNLGGCYPLLAKLCNVEVTVIRKLRFGDLAQVVAAAAHFIPFGRLIGLIK